MDVPITLGVLLAARHVGGRDDHHAEHAYFDSAMMLLAFLLVGRFLDQNMRRRTRAVAGNLAALKAETAVKFVSPDEISRGAGRPIHAGRPGAGAPGRAHRVDGVVTTAARTSTRAWSPAKRAPVDGDQGAMVYAGTMNLSGTLRIRVAAAAKGTLLDEVTRLLDSAAAGALAPRAARRVRRELDRRRQHDPVFATLIGWVAFGASWHDAIITSIAVLIITCPCALGLAIPAVQVVASGALFRAGVLLNAGDAIERLADADTIVFDKTGTLTLPEPEVVNAAQIPAELLRLAGRLALATRHPLAAAVARAAGASVGGAKVPLEGAIEEPGQGVSAVVDEIELRLGRPSYCGAEREAEALAHSDPQSSQIAFAHGEDRYVLAVRQRLRGDAVAVIAELRGRGLALESSRAIAPTRSRASRASSASRAGAPRSRRPTRSPISRRSNSRATRC